MHPEISRPKVQMKGIRDGLLVTLGEGPWYELRQNLLDQISAQPDFWRGARLALDVGNLALKAAELGSLRDILSEKGITLWAVLSNSPLTEGTAQALGIATRISKPRPERSTVPLETTVKDAEAAVLVRRTLRSGYRLEHAGHVIVIGDVNPGAEIIASGDIIIWGHLRGAVHAGAEGEATAVVCALSLFPTQLRIAGQIAVTTKRKGKPQPEMARLLEGRVILEAWKPNTKKD